MNLPNKLTLMRVILIPFFVFFLLISSIPNNYLWATIIFVLASLTDALDGYIARSRNLITDFGKFLDPLADKMLVISALVCFIELRLLGSVVVLIIIAREFLVTSLRLVVVSSNGTVIAANIWGKLKTISQMVAVIAILIFSILSQQEMIPASFNYIFAGNLLMWVAAILTIISGMDYLIKNIRFINTSK